MDFMEVKEMKGKRALFNIDGDTRTFKGYTFDRYWNGFAIPFFEKEVAKEVCKYLTCDEIKIDFNDEINIIIITDEWGKDVAEFEKMQTVDGEKELVTIGNGWVWEQFELGDFEHTPEQMANKLMLFVRDMGDDWEDIDEEIDALIPTFEELMSSEKFNGLAHQLDLMFMDPAFDFKEV